MIEDNVHGTVSRLLSGHVIVYNKLFTRLPKLNLMIGLPNELLRRKVVGTTNTWG